MQGVPPEQEQAGRTPPAPGPPVLGFYWWRLLFLFKGETSDLDFIFVTRGLSCFSFHAVFVFEWFRCRFSHVVLASARPSSTVMTRADGSPCPRAVDILVGGD